MGHEILQNLLLLREAKKAARKAAKHIKRCGKEKLDGGGGRMAKLVRLIGRRKMLANQSSRPPAIQKSPDNNTSRTRRTTIAIPKCSMPTKENSFETDQKPRFSRSVRTFPNASSQSAPFSLAFLANLMPPNSSKIAELIATERDYIFQLEMCHRIYIRTFRRQQQMEGPPKYTEHQLFGNWTQIRHFHRSVLLPRLQLAICRNCPNPLFPIFHLFLLLAPQIRQIYLPFLESRSTNGHLIRTKHFQEWTKAVMLRHGLGPAQSLDFLQIRPIQRLFQLATLLAGMECQKGDKLTRSVRQEAVNAIRAIPRLANDWLHLKRVPIGGSRGQIPIGQLALLGDLVCSDEFQLKANRKAAKIMDRRGGGGNSLKRRWGQRKGKKCRVFLFQRGLLLAKLGRRRQQTKDFGKRRREEEANGGERRKGRGGGRRSAEEGEEAEKGQMPLKAIGCIPFFRLIRLEWDGGIEFCLFLRCSFAQSARRRRPLGKIRFRANNQATAFEWMRRLGAQVPCPPSLSLVPSLYPF